MTIKKIRVILFGCLVFGLIGACSQVEETASVATDHAIHSEEHTTVVPTALLTLDVKGMSCEMGCGASIRKELLSTKAVDRVKFDFKMGREVNVAEVFYNDSQISAEEITQLVEHINDQQFSVQPISNTPLSAID